MQLFENENIIISKLSSVQKFNSKVLYGGKKVQEYPVNLKAYELIYQISGGTEVIFSNKKFAPTQDSVRFLPMGKTEGVYKSSALNHGECIDIFFLTDNEMPDEAILMKNMSELKPLFLKMYTVWDSKKNGYHSKCMSIFYEIISKIKTHDDNYCSDAKAQRINPSYEYMVEHLADYNFDFKEMCAKSGFSYDYFKKLFVKKYKLSPVKYLTMLRMEKAKELLITRHYKIGEIADMCGFEDVPYFSNTFKKYCGVSPQNYKYYND